MKFSHFSIASHLLLMLIGTVTASAIAVPSVLAEPGQIQTKPIEITPETLRDDVIFRQDQRICGSRSQRQCKEWLEKIRAAQEVRGIRIPQPQPDPSPELIRIPPNEINPRQ